MPEQQKWQADARRVMTARGNFIAQTPEQAKLIVKAVNMHDRLVAHLDGLLPDCSINCNTGGTCNGCPDECETYQLLKEARGEK